LKLALAFSGCSELVFADRGNLEIKTFDDLRAYEMPQVEQVRNVSRLFVEGKHGRLEVL
jgi:hypothetical protein